MIKSIHSCASNILAVASDNKLWIMGENKYRKTGLGINNKPIYSPIFTGIELAQNETVTKFYCHKYLLAIYTSKGNLWVSRHLFPNKYHTSTDTHHGSYGITYADNDDDDENNDENNGHNDDFNTDDTDDDDADDASDSYDDIIVDVDDEFLWQ